MSTTKIITRHAGAVEWLRRQGITGEVIPHIYNAAQVRGMTVIGAVPLHLAAECLCVGSIDLPGLPPNLRGAELTADEMEAAGATLRWYMVTPIEASTKLQAESHAAYLSGVLMH